jgi:sigma 54 modulation/S30EA-like ribosomal protein
MTIQFNTDHNLDGNEKFSVYFMELISTELSRYRERITRVEVHVTDVNGHKGGPNDKRCVMEARVKGRGPVVVTCTGDTPEQVIQAALQKLSLSMESIHSQMSKHRL